MRRGGVEEREFKPRERKAKSADEALKALMRQCARSERSSGDALRLMRQWGVAETEQQKVLQKLIEQRFINDRRYAEAYSREKSRLAGWGSRKIVLQLRQKGVASDIIEDVVSQLDGDEQLQRLVDKLQRKRSSTKAVTTYELRGKLLRYALGLGYDYDLAIAAVDSVTE